MDQPVRPDLYISADVETDGPIPGPYSMLSFAMAIAGSFDGEVFRRRDPEAETFYCELKPISQDFEEEALAVNGLDREALKSSGREPREAMVEACAWVCEASRGHRPVLVAYPVAYDWSFLFWYFVRFAESPFGYSSCLDIRTLYQARAHTIHDLSSKSRMPDWLLPRSPHTHHALGDAVEQAELFSNVFEWVLEGPQAALTARDLA